MTAVLSIGSNVGDRLAFLRLAVERLEPTAVSSIWQTAPVGGVEQDDYLNAVLRCELDAGQAWQLAQRSEQLAGRVRDVRWGPRTLDVDLVVADGPVPDGLTLPHPRAHERAFVLAPWLELDPEARLPQGRVADLLHGLDGQGVTRTDLRLRA